jgi:predicted acyltransferase
MLVVLVGWILAPFAGGLVASRVAARSRRQYAWVIAGVLLAATLANLRAVPHPAWMVVGGLIGVPAAGWLAARLAPRDES